jgi:hypothetical protein
MTEAFLRHFGFPEIQHVFLVKRCHKNALHMTSVTFMVTREKADNEEEGQEKLRVKREGGGIEGYRCN